MKPTPPRQDRNVSFTNTTQATCSTATKEPGREQSRTSFEASVPNVCMRVRVCNEEDRAELKSGTKAKAHKTSIGPCGKSGPQKTSA